MSGLTELTDPIQLLEECLCERSRGTMMAPLRDVWLMACHRNYPGTYDDARQLLAASGRYDLAGERDNPVMIRPR
jgi:hypothetical protein